LTLLVRKHESHDCEDPNKPSFVPPGTLGEGVGLSLSETADATPILLNRGKGAFVLALGSLQVRKERPAT